MKPQCQSDWSNEKTEPASKADNLRSLTSNCKIIAFSLQSGFLDWKRRTRVKVCWFTSLGNAPRVEHGSVLEPQGANSISHYFRKWNIHLMAAGFLSKHQCFGSDRHNSDSLSCKSPFFLFPALAWDWHAMSFIIYFPHSTAFVLGWEMSTG